SAITDKENNAPSVLAPPGTSAIIHSGATVNAGVDINVKANELAHITNFVGQIAGGVVGVGAAIDIVTIGDNVTAIGGGTLTAGGAISVMGILDDHITITTLDGSAGGVALGAAVAVVKDSSATQASLEDSAIVNNAASLTVSADTTRVFSLTTGKAAIGAAALGVTFTQLTVTGNTTASVGNNVHIGQSVAVGTVTVSSRATVDATLNTVLFDVAGAAADASFAIIDVTPDVKATIGDGALITATGAVTVSAEGTKIKADSEITGVSVGIALTLSGYFATPTVGGTTQASIGSNGSV